MSDITISYENTPNPQSLKFLVNRDIADETADFRDAMSAGRSPLASKIFGFPWTDGVYVGPNYITITKQDWVEWDVLADPLCGLIKEHLESDQPVLLEAQEDSSDDNDSPVVKKIKEILDREVRPAVALDGGDIVFQRYENMNVFVTVQLMRSTFY